MSLTNSTEMLTKEMLVQSKYSNSDSYILDSEKYKKDRLLSSLRSSGRYNQKIQLLMGDLDSPMLAPSPKRRRSVHRFSLPHELHPVDLQSCIDVLPKHASDAVSKLWEHDEPHEYTIWLGNSHFPAPVPMYREEVCNICHLFCLIH